MTTPGSPDEPSSDPTPERPSLFERLAEFEPEDDDLFEDEYDDDPAGEGADAPAEDVTSYDDSAFAAVGDDSAPEAAEPAEDGHPPHGPTAHGPAAHEPAAHGPTAPGPTAPDPSAAAPTPLAAAPVDAPAEVPADLPTELPAAVAAHEPVPEPSAGERPTEQPPAEEPPAEEPLPAATPQGRESRRRRSSGGRRLTLPVIALLVMTVLLAAATAYLWLQVRDHDRTESARRSGLEASRDAARLLFSYDYRTLDKDFSTGRGLTTGEFRKQYDKTTTKVVADVAKQYKAVVKANVVAAGVVRATPDTVVTVVYVNQVTTSTRVTGEKVDLSRVRMTLHRTGGRWLVTSVNAL